MTKKEIGIVVLVLGVITVFAVGLVVFMARKDASQPAATSSPAQGGVTSLADVPAPETPAVDAAALNVTEAANTTNPAQLGSGLIASKPNGGTAAPASIPAPETFGQYEKYKTGQSALFGDLEEGTGNTASSGKKLAVLYKGYLTNGTIFDQSRTGADGKYQPFVFTLGAGQVIQGWEQAIAGMKVGGTRRLIIPPAVGYGATAKSNIPANSVLIFDVQLIAIQ